MPATHDAIVVGLGAMGAATAMHLAERGVSVLAFDAYEPPHKLGSHHGESRIIRKAYYEHPGYVPLLHRAFDQWRDLERRTGRSLLRLTGGLMIGPPEGELVGGVLASVREHGLTHELLDAQHAAERFNWLRLDRSMLAVWEADAGVLYPEICVTTMLDIARERGASLHYREPIRAWRETSAGVEVETPQGRYQAGTLLLCCGGGLADLAPALSASLRVERQIVAHFCARQHSDQFDAGRLPIFILEEDDAAFFYGLPDLGNGLKVGQHHAGSVGDLASVDRQVGAVDIEIIRRFLERHMPDANGRLLAAMVCLYTNTPDFHFLIDRLPAADRVLVASACSGHGFKFATVVGECMADLAMGRTPMFDLSMFRAERLAASRAS